MPVSFVFGFIEHIRADGDSAIRDLRQASLNGHGAGMLTQVKRRASRGRWDATDP